MKVGRLIASLGIAQVEGELDVQTKEMVVRHLSLFLRAGGRLELREWLLLDETEKACFAEAGDRVAVERAIEAIAMTAVNAGDRITDALTRAVQPPFQVEG